MKNRKKKKKTWVIRDGLMRCVGTGVWGRGRDWCYGYFYLLKIYCFMFNFDIFIGLLSNKRPI